MVFVPGILYVAIEEYMYNNQLNTILMYVGMCSVYTLGWVLTVWAIAYNQMVLFYRSRID